MSDTQFVRLGKSTMIHTARTVTVNYGHGDAQALRVDCGLSALRHKPQIYRKPVTVTCPRCKAVGQS